MKKISLTIIGIVTYLMFSCSPKFEVENTATESLAGNWMCTIFLSDTLTDITGNDSIVWEYYSEAEYVTYNTAQNISSEMWINDYENFWGTLCKVKCNAGKQTFGNKEDIYTDEYNDVGQKIYNGKVTKDGAVAPGSRTIVDKIEFNIQFEDDSTPYGTTYLVVGYCRTGFPEDDDNFIYDWQLPEQK